MLCHFDHFPPRFPKLAFQPFSPSPKKSRRNYPFACDPKKSVGLLPEATIEPTKEEFVLDGEGVPSNAIDPVNENLCYEVLQLLDQIKRSTASTDQSSLRNPGLVVVRPYSLQSPNRADWMREAEFLPQARVEREKRNKSVERRERGVALFSTNTPFILCLCNYECITLFLCEQRRGRNGV